VPGVQKQPLHRASPHHRGAVGRHRAQAGPELGLRQVAPRS
jgi:hypothetical protein